MLAALNFVLGASIRRLWALRTQKKSIERDVCAPVVLAHQHVVAPIWVQRDPERINHKSGSIGYKPLRSEDELIRKETSNVVMDGFNSTNSSELTPIRDGATLLSPSARWVNAPAPDSLYQCTSFQHLHQS